MRTAEIEKIVQMPSLADDAELVQPSDHCVNHTCEGACNCGLTDRAIFRRVSRGVYLAL
jgi:hypothetical protein